MKNVDIKQIGTVVAWKNCGKYLFVQLVLRVQACTGTEKNKTCAIAIVLFEA